MFCPNCRSEYRTGFVRCSDCDVALVDHLPETARNVDVVKVFETQDRALATFVESLLRGKSIEFFTKYSNTDVSVFGLEPTQFFVASDDVRAARDLIAEADAPSDTFSPREPGHARFGPRKSVHAIHISHYSRKTGELRGEDISDPSWQIVEREIRTMDRYTKPLIFLMTAEDDTESDCMAITGGGDFCHLQISDSDGRWQEAVNPGRGSREIEVWTSDQGFTTEERYTWSIEDAIRIAKFFWDEERPSPDVEWS